MPLLPGEPPHADDVAERGTKEWRQAVAAHQEWVGAQLWEQNATNGPNLSDPNAMQSALAALGIANEVGGGRHAYNMFMPGDLGGLGAAEGWGVSPVDGRDGMAYALEAFMPDWRHDLDRAIQSGTPRHEANAQFMPDGATSPGAASYTNPAAIGMASLPGTQPTMGAASAPSNGMVWGHSAPGSSSSEAGGGAGGAAVSGEDDALKRAKFALKRKTPGFTLGNLGWGS